MGKICLCCAEDFVPYPGRPDQGFCSKAGCQRERRRRWHREKMVSDPVYRQGQSDCQRDWRERHPDYWRKYRAAHLDYCERNRRKQRERDRRHSASPAGALAKMDEVTRCNDIESGRYILVPFREGRLAKMDEAIVQLTVINGINSVESRAGP
jgi:hypothetical protein